MSWFVHAEDNYGPEPKVSTPEEEEEDYLQLGSKPYTQLERRVVSVEVAASAAAALVNFSARLFQDILNHILNDIEIIMGQVGAALAKKASKKKKKKGVNGEMKACNLIIRIHYGLFFSFNFSFQIISTCPHRQNSHPVSKKSNTASICW